jgi:hypothetical protein
MTADTRRPPPVDALDDPAADPGDDDDAPLSGRPTLPAGAAYSMLRDSCRATASGEEISLEELTPQQGTPAARFIGPDLAAAEALATSDLDRVPYVVLSRAELEFLALDADSEALLGAMDGTTKVRALAAACGVDPARAQQIMTRLANRGVVRLRH